MRAGMLILLFVGITAAAGEMKPPGTAGGAMNVEFSVRNAAGVQTLEFRQDETVRFRRAAIAWKPHSTRSCSRASGNCRLIRRPQTLP